MKFVIVLAALIVATLAAPQGDVQILRQEQDVRIDGYNYAYETSDGTAVQESGQLKNVGTDDEGIAVSGSFKYVGDDGNTYEVNYTADEQGFVPVAEHLPVAPSP